VSGSRKRLVLAALVVVVIAVGVALGIWLTEDDKQPLTHDEYAKLYAQAVPQQSRIEIVDDWPKPPYQDFKDNAQNHCFEWSDQPVALYTLCFNKNGVLSSKNKN
jgi:hypothetical protein